MNHTRISIAADFDEKGGEDGCQECGSEWDAIHEELTEKDAALAVALVVVKRVKEKIALWESESGGNVSLRLAFVKLFTELLGDTGQEKDAYASGGREEP